MAKATAQASVGAHSSASDAVAREAKLIGDIPEDSWREEARRPRRAMRAAAQSRHHSIGRMDQCAIGMNASTPMPARFGETSAHFAAVQA